jgi:predicted type IV restriction endonuclease
MEDDLVDIRNRIRAGRFPNEATVSQGIVRRLLDLLSWPVYDTDIVMPEYSVSGRRVDYALCHPPQKPIVFIEVKQVGQTSGADRQLFEYDLGAEADEPGLAQEIWIPLRLEPDGRR